MDPLTLLEKLINEHASAAALRDHLAFLRDKFAHVTQENSVLQKENAELKDLSARLQKELRGQVRDDPDELSNRAFEILCWIHDEDGEVTIERIVEKMKIGAPEARMHIQKLWTRSFISEPGDGLDDPPGYHIIPDGTEYVLNRRA
jgi:NADPH-dependent ferric siderophore reductase